MYKQRAVDHILAELIKGMGAVLIEGPRGCGKTSTGLHHSRSSIRLDRSPELIQLAELNPTALLEGETPRLVDEWQLAPSLWNAMRHEIDDRQQRGQFILSGSAQPASDVTRHSGAGRFGRLRMRPMALAESEASSSDISLSALKGASTVSARSPLSYQALAEQAVRGGWPGLLDVPARQAVLFNRSYCDDLCDSDIPAAVGVRHDPARMRKVLQSIARNVAAEATAQSLRRDVSGADAPLNYGTVNAYLDSLETVFALDNLPAWSVNLRSKSRLRTAPKLQLADPALACAVLGVGADRLAKSPEYFGQVFEAMVIRDLRALASAESGQVYHYRDSTGLEIDAIIEYPDDGYWGACEVKLGQSQVEAAERNLIKLRDERVDLDRVGEPAFLAVVTGTEYAYTLPSGVHVIPLGTLGI